MPVARKDGTPAKRRTKLEREKIFREMLKLQIEGLTQNEIAKVICPQFDITEESFYKYYIKNCKRKISPIIDQDRDEFIKQQLGELYLMIDKLESEKQYMFSAKYRDLLYRLSGAYAPQQLQVQNIVYDVSFGDKNINEDDEDKTI